MAVTIQIKHWPIPLNEQERIIFQAVAHAAAKMGVKAYAIGGFVRDKLLGRPVKEIDFVCVGDSIALARAAAKCLPGKTSLVQVFKRFGTAHFVWQDYSIEFVTARRESYHPDSRNPDVEPASLEEDLLRRDFTINTLAISLQESSFDQLLDAFEGLEDLRQKRIRTPADPIITFRDDPLRMMRAIRFATQLHFHLAPELVEAISQEAPRIQIVSQERITDELNKILMAQKPSIGFEWLFKTGLLQLIFPQMVALAGVEMIDGKGHKDNFYHTLQVVDNVAARSDKLWLRWAALLHDIGKPATKRFDPQQGWTFHGHEVVGARMVPKIFAQLKLPTHQPMEYVKKLVLLHLRPISLTKENITDSAIRRLLFEAGDDLEDLMLLCEADITSRNPQKVKRYLQNFALVRKRLQEVEEKDRIRNWQPPITGEMIMERFKLPPCKLVGDIKNAIREAILDGKIGNNFEEAWEYMIQVARELQVPNVD
ncbi:MAG: CCA tRNA nucleotidyltransferase [Thermoflavifilum sp.]|nr:CCA tRNA nucleotidyltransferase [Thermoflavifilum sp.]